MALTMCESIRADRHAGIQTDRQTGMQTGRQAAGRHAGVVLSGVSCYTAPRDPDMYRVA